MQFGDIINNPYCDNKQRLNLSDYAHAVLINDIGAFQPENTLKRGLGELSSNIINHIFRSFRSMAESSISIALQKKKLELDSMFEKISDVSERSAAISICFHAYKEQLFSKASQRLKEKGYAFSIRIDHENLDFLSSIGNQSKVDTTENYINQATSEFFTDNVGKYIKAVIEEYCEHSYVEREQIYFCDILDKLQLAMSGHQMLKLTLHTKQSSSNKYNMLYVKPFCRQEDSEHMYNYIVGTIARSPDGPWSIGSVRLTSIKTCAILTHPVHISKETQKEIHDAIKLRGVQYLSSVEDPRKIVVELTPEGEKLYRKILHLRPLYTTKNGSIYEFNCTTRQADNYFFKFGHNVKILEPESLAQDFARRYLSAAQQYESS